MKPRAIQNLPAFSHLGTSVPYGNGLRWGGVEGGGGHPPFSEKEKRISGKSVPEYIYIGTGLKAMRPNCLRQLANQRSVRITDASKQL